MLLKPDGILLELRPQDATVLASALDELQWHLSNMTKALASVRPNRYLTAVYSDTCAELFSTYKRTVESAADRCRQCPGHQPIFSPDYRGDVERMLLEKYGIDYEILPRRRTVAIATGNGPFEIPGAVAEDDGGEVCG